VWCARVTFDWSFLAWEFGIPSELGAVVLFPQTPFWVISMLLVIPGFFRGVGFLYGPRAVCFYPFGWFGGGISGG